LPAAPHLLIVFFGFGPMADKARSPNRGRCRRHLQS
jgi:hypothetical protein